MSIQHRLTSIKSCVTEVNCDCCRSGAVSRQQLKELQRNQDAKRRTKVLQAPGSKRRRKGGKGDRSDGSSSEGEGGDESVEEGDLDIDLNDLDLRLRMDVERAAYSANQQLTQADVSLLKYIISACMYPNLALPAPQNRWEK